MKLIVKSLLCMLVSTTANGQILPVVDGGGEAIRFLRKLWL